jgi:prepilin-type N-terminal cleavage/methylation domain-containing protein
MRARQGFTLIEMLVATALVIFIMVILTQAFTTGMDAFRYLKTIGDMQEKLRTATTIIRRDLVADHFDGKRRLSDANFWVIGPPREGFFRIWQGYPLGMPLGAPRYTDEGMDGDGIHSYQATDHYLHFTVKRRGNRRDEFASAVIPDPKSPFFLQWQAMGWRSPDSRFQDATNTTNIFNSQWYEVAYFLKDSGEVTPGGTKRYTLYRRQRLAVTDNYNLNWTAADQVPQANASNYVEISCFNNLNANNNTFLYFNNPTDLTVPERRFGMNTTTTGGYPTEADLSYPLLVDTNNQATGADLLLTDVISFQVQVMFVGATTWSDVPANTNPTLQNFRVFDTWSSLTDKDPNNANPQPGTVDYSQWSVAGNATSAPVQQSIKAIQISIRIWDIKTQLTRQITLVQDM